MNITEEYYKKRGLRLVKELTKRNFQAEYFDDSASAVQAIIRLIPEESSVSWGGSVTMDETGLKEKLKKGSYTIFDRSEAKTPEAKEKIIFQGMGCDYYIMSANAITMDGLLVNTDGNGNRLAALIYGPKNIIVLAGMNKVVSDEAAARNRIKSIAAPMNAMRLEKKTPCAKNGECADCLSPDSICSQTVITRKSIVKDRIKIFLVGENLGY